MSVISSGNGFAGAVETFLRTRHPQKTAMNVEADTRGACHAAQVRKWLDGVAVPSGPAMLILTATYGPEFLAAVMPGMGWIDESVRAARAERLQAQIAEAQRQLSEIQARQR